MKLNEKWVRMYVDGVDISGYVNSFGSLGVVRETTDVSSIIAVIKNITLGRPAITAGPINSIIDASAGSPQMQFSAVAERYIAILFGSNREPVADDLMFAWKMAQSSFVTAGGNSLGVNFNFDGAASGMVAYGNPWGRIVLPKSTKTAANSSDTNIVSPTGSATTHGGLFVYHLFSSDGAVTLSLEGSTNGTGSWTAVEGATSGSINASSTPKFGIAEMATNYTVKKYIRWQLDLGSSSTATFMLGLIRG
jgi:hypothetical protein